MNRLFERLVNKEFRADEKIDYKKIIESFKKLTVIVLVFLFVLTPVLQVMAAEVELLTSATSTPTEAVETVENFESPVTEEPVQEDPTTTEVESEVPEDPPPGMLDSETDPDIRLDNGYTLKNLSKADESTGALITEYPLTVPPGRNGFQPDLKLQYNSQNSNETDSQFGAGWSLNIPYIERLNRQGVNNLYSTTTPYFNSSLSGELVKTSTTTYVTRTENGDFLSYTFDNDSWIVRDKKGYEYYFGFSRETTSTSSSATTTELFETGLEDDPSLLSYYRLEGNSTDTTGSYNGTPTSMSYGTSYGKFNQGGLFNGSSSKIDAGSQLNSGTNFWVHGWFKVQSVPGLNSNTALFGNSAWTGNGQIQANLRGTGSSQFKLQFDVYGTTSIDSASTTLAADTWYMWDFAYDYTNKLLKIYINGSLNATSIFATSQNLSNSTFLLGNNGAINNFYSGYIDDIAVFSRIPTTTEVSMLYSGGWNSTTTEVFSSKQDDFYDTSRTNKWFLDHVLDPNGNQITYEYYKSKGQIYPARVSYAGNTTSTPLYNIDFSREARTDISTSTKTGFRVVTDSRINDITVKMNSDWMKKYTLSYTTGDNTARSLLSSIVESGRDESGATTTKPATSFTYQTSTGSWSDPGVIFPKKLDYGVLADVNGDQYSDLIYSVTDTSTTTQISYLNDTQNGWATSSAYTSPYIFYGTGTNCDVVLCDKGVRLLDLNGDGLTDLLRNGDTAYLNTGSGWNASTTWNSPVSFANPNQNYGNNIYADIGDVNGDGLPDVFKVWHTEVEEYHSVYFNNGNGWASSTTWSVALGIDKQRGRITTDLNGDGLTDLIQSLALPPGADNEYVVLSNGTSTWESASFYISPLNFVNNTSDEGVRVYDMNGDGLPDLSKNLAVWGVAGYLNTGGGWSTAAGLASPLSFASSVVSTDQGTRIAYMNGDGMVDIVQAKNDGYGGITSNSKYSLDKKADTLIKITYPTGGSTNITYKGSGQYKDGSNNLLNPNLPINVDTVYQITNHDGVATSTTDTFTYKNGKYYFNGPFDRKFAGFGEVDKTDLVGSMTKTFFHQGNTSASTTGEYLDSFYKIGKPYRVEKYDPISNLTEKTINKWDSATTSVSGFVKLAQTVTFAYDGAATHKDKAEAYTFSSSTGNTLQKIEYGEVIGSDDGTFTDTGLDKFTTTYTYATSSTSSVISLLSGESTVNQSSSKVKESRYYYDTLALNITNKGNLTKKEDWKTSSTYIDIEKTYNNYGLVVTEKDARDKVSTSTYDSYNLYPTTITSPVNHVTQFTYDYSSGKVKQTTDPNGNNFQNVYDGLDRLIEVKQPDPNTTSSLLTKFTLAYTDIANSVSVRKTNYLSSTTTVDSYVYFDGLGRKKQERTESEGANYVVKDYAYNNLGLLQKESLPYFSSGSSTTTISSTASLFLNYFYDSLGRVATTSNAVGTTTNAYLNWKTTTTDPLGKVKKFYNDAYNNLIRVDEVNATATYITLYAYNYLGNLTNATDTASSTRIFTYDGLGRRLTAQDLHATSDASFGSYTYTFDDAGNLTTKVDPKSQTINYTYDDINRLLTENFTGLAGTEVTYTYDSCTQGKGLICTASSSVVYLTNTFNALGQLTQEVKLISGTSFTSSYGYDRQGNQLNITNPDSSQVQYVYNSAGQVNQIQRKESSDSAFIDVLTNIDYAPTGQPAVLEYFNGAVTTNTYDSTKLYRLTRKLTTLPDSESFGFRSEPPPEEEMLEEIPTEEFEESSTSTPVTSSSTLDSLLENASTTPETSTTTVEIIPSEEDLLVPEVSTTTPDLEESEVLEVVPDTQATSTPETENTEEDEVLSLSKIYKYIVSKISNAFRYLAQTFSLKKVIAAATELYSTAFFSDANLIAYYRMEDTSDSKGSYTLTGVNSPSSVTAKFANGYSYDTTNYHHTNSNLGINGGAITMSGWLKINSNPSSGTTWYLASQFNSTAQVEYDFWYGNSGGTYSFSVNRGKSGVSDNPVSVNINLNDSEYHHVALTYDGTDLIGYLDGASFGSLSTSGNGSGGSVNDFVIAAAYNGTSKANVSWDDYAVFTRALTEAEIQEIAAAQGPTQTVQDLNYTYDTNGNITEFSEFASTTLERTLVLTYDDLNRLTSASTTKATSTPFKNSYAYSPTGNMLSRTENGTATNYLYNGNVGTNYANPHAATKIGTATSTYDRNGNLVAEIVSSATTTAYTWDYNNLLTRASSTPGTGGMKATSTYDSFGQRAKYVTGTSTVTTTFYPTKGYNSSTVGANSTSTKHIFLGDMLVATIVGSNASSTVYYAHTDHLGGASVVTNDTPEIVELVDYYPYGNTRIDQRPTSFREQRKFTGHEQDLDTGLIYANARYYNGTSGRFNSQDLVFLALGDKSQIKQLAKQDAIKILSDPQALNSYSYSRNNPLRYIDPDGLWFQETLSWINAKTGIGSAVENNRAYNYATTHKGVPYAIAGSSLTLLGGAGVLYGLSAAGISSIGTTCLAVCSQAGQLGAKDYNAAVNWVSSKFGADPGSLPSRSEVQNVMSKWVNTNMPDKQSSILYHFNKHANGSNLNQLTQNGVNVWNSFVNNSSSVARVGTNLLMNGQTGIRIDLSNGAGGVFTQGGGIVTTWFK